MNQQQSNRRGHFYSIIMALIIGLIGTAWSLHHPRPQPEQPQLPQAGEGLTVYFLPAGEGQCVLMTCAGKALLLDAGDEGFGQTAVEFIRARSLRQISLLVSSRPAEAYSGGLTAVVQNYPINAAWCAAEADESKAYTAFLAAIDSAGRGRTVPRDGETFSLGDAVITARTAEGGTLALEFAYGETSGSVGMPDRSDALKPVRTDDVTVWVSDGEQLVCLTEAGDS